MNKVLALRWLKKQLGEIFSLLPVTAVFFLTVEQLASLLNTCKSGNFPATEQREFSSLIMNYFVSNLYDPEWSDDECSSEPDIEIQSVHLSLFILHPATLSINNSQITPHFR